MELTNIYVCREFEEPRYELDLSKEDLWDIWDALQAKNTNYSLTDNQRDMKNQLDSILEVK